MGSLTWVFGLSMVSVIAEFIMKEFGQERKANLIGIISNVTIMFIVVKLVFNLLNGTIEMFDIK